MKPAAEHQARPEQPSSTINSFNIDDGHARGQNQADEHEAPAEPASESGSARRRSPSPSVISTASSGSPLIRSDSSTSSDTLAGVGLAGGSSRGRQQHSTKQHQQQVAALKRPAPTSIAAAQLRQQLQGHAQPENPNHPNKSQKHQSGNKLAHMAKLAAKSQLAAAAAHPGDQPVDYRLKSSNSMADNRSAAGQQRDKPKKRPNDAEENGKSFGYNLGKAIAYRANRFNEFWSINKMRYMNLACLLMTLVCLLTILLFSKSTLTNTSSQSASVETGGRQSQLSSPQFIRPISLEERMKHRSRMPLDYKADRDRRDDDSEQESPVESIDSMDRQPFVRSPSQRHSAEHADDDDQAASHDESSTASRAASSDGFNLFDERHEEGANESPSGSSSSKRSLDDLLQDARRQLRRQQENEQEMDELASSNKSLWESADSSNNSAKQRPATDPISQVLQDLDGFGLFKSIKSRLVDQLQHQNLTSKQPTIVRSKNGATIIMSFSGDSQNNSTSKQNETSDAMPSFLRDLLPPMMGGGSGSSLFDTRPSGFAAITINAEPMMSIRSSNLPFGSIGLDSSPGSAGPFMIPPPFGFGLSPFMSAPSQRPPLMAGGGGGGGFMSMIMRASSELANQMRQQLDAANADNQTTRAGSNGTTGSSNSAKQDQQASQQVKVIQLLGGGAIPSLASVEVAKNDSKPTSGNTTNPDDEVETFGLGRLVSSPTTRQATFRLPLMPNFRSVYTTRRSALPIGGGGTMMMIESSSGIPSSIMSGESSSSSLAGGPLSPGAFFLNEIGSNGGLNGPAGLSSLMPPFPIMPSVFLVGGQQRPNGRLPEPVNPMLRSILSNVMSDLSQSVLDEGNQRAKARDEAKPSSSVSSRRDDNQEDNEWDELGGSQEAKSRPRSRSADASDLMGDSSDAPDDQEHPMRMAAPLFEHILDQMNTGDRTRTFGTIKQTIRGPNGVLVERVIGLPPSGRGHEQHEVQAVPAGVRSQSLSRAQPNSGPTSSPPGEIYNTSKARHSPFARLFGGDLSESDSSSKPAAVSSPMGFISQLLGQELASDRHDDGNGPEVSPINSRGFRAHISAVRPSRRSISRPASFDMDSDDEPPFWPALPRVRVASARIRLVSPRSDSGPAQLYFRPPTANPDEKHADDSSEQPPLMIPNQPNRLAPSPFTSPNSPLFGFPVPKAAQAAGPEMPSGPQQQDSNQAVQHDGEREQVGEPAQPGSHRRQRSFVYHSNHEIASNQARRMASSGEQRRGATGESQPAEQRSAGPVARPVQRQVSSLPPAASIVMGRRLDDFVEARS